MLISVIIPTYKPKSYFWVCLDSLCNQTFPRADYEVIIVLNGCSDSYEKEIKNYIGKHSSTKFVLVQTEEPGVSNARNIGIDLAEGEYITFIDDDDFVSPKYLEELFNTASVDVVSLCYPLAFLDGTRDYQPYRITDDYIKHAGVKEPFPIIKAKRFFSGPVYKLIHKSIIGDRRFYKDFVLSEDSIFMFLISDRIRGVAFTSKDAIYYRRNRKDSTLHRYSIAYYLKNTIRCFKEYTKIYLSGKYSFVFYVTRILGGINLCLETIHRKL